MIRKGRKQHEGLKQIISNSIANNSSAICLLYGFQGFGRKSCVYSVMNDLEDTHPMINLIFISMDAYIHNTEKIFVNAFIQKLNDHADIIGDNQLLKRDYQDSFTFQRLNEYLQVIKKNTLNNKKLIYQVEFGLYFSNHD